MPVTIYLSDKTPTTVSFRAENGRQARAATPHALLASTGDGTFSKRCVSMFQSSFTDDILLSLNDDIAAGAPSSTMADADTNLSAIPVISAYNSNGLVDAIRRAYSEHCCLALRPDDVWMAILAQLMLLLKRTSETLPPDLEPQIFKCRMEPNPNVAMNCENMIRELAESVQESFLKEETRDWMYPDFTTTNAHDRMTCSAIVMSKGRCEGHTSEFRSQCGIPKVTLLGERADWLKLASKIGRIKQHGEDAKRWHSQLLPVLISFTASFGLPASEEAKRFWRRMVAYDERDNDVAISGWITAFCFFDTRGRSLRSTTTELVHKLLDTCLKLKTVISDPLEVKPEEDVWDVAHELSLGGVIYHSVLASKIPPATAFVDITLHIGPHVFSTIIVAGLVGIRVEDSGMEADGHDGKMDVLRPQAGWWWFIENHLFSPPRVDALSGSRIGKYKAQKDGTVQNHPTATTIIGDEARQDEADEDEFFECET